MSTKLIDKKCIPCEGFEKPMESEEIRKYLSLLKSEWEVVDDKKISHSFKFKSFQEAIAFVSKVADLVEKENHHPNIHILYNKVKIVLSTHSIGGLSENDFILAAKIERLLNKR